jgi:hypothetical protein
MAIKPLDRARYHNAKARAHSWPFSEGEASLLPFADATGLSSYIYTIIRSFYESKALCLQ